MSATTAQPGVACEKCVATPCLALVRADTPPSGALDFVDRELKMIACGHWTWRHTLHVIALIGVSALIVCAIWWLAATHIPVAAIWSEVSGSPTAWIVGSGGALVSGGGAVWWRRHYRRQAQAVPVPIQLVPPATEQEDDNGVDEQQA